VVVLTIFITPNLLELNQYNCDKPFEKEIMFRRVKSNQDFLVESIVKKVISEIADTSSHSTETKKTKTKTTKRGRNKEEQKSVVASKCKKKTTKKKKRQGSKSKDVKLNKIELLITELQDLKVERGSKYETTIPPSVSMNMREYSARQSGMTASTEFYDHTIMPLPTRSVASRLVASRSVAPKNKGSVDFYRSVASKLGPHCDSICIQEDSDRPDTVKDENSDFQAAFRPDDMRCLALVSHNEMKSTMKGFVEFHKHVLKKFRLTGTESTMTMLSEVFADEPDVVFGPTCSSGPLGETPSSWH